MNLKHKLGGPELIAVLSTYNEPDRTDPFAWDLDGTVYAPEMHRTTYAMNTAILCSALFGVGSGTLTVGVDGKKKFLRQYIERAFPTTNGAIIEYRGKELHQDDLTVLLGLLNCHAGKATTCALEFAPSTFCTQLGWSDTNHNITRLQECLHRLRGAYLAIRTKKSDTAAQSKLARAIGSGWTLGFVAYFAWEGLARWSVQLDSRISQLFGNAPTYLIAAKRKSLSEGLQTWLYGYVEANTCAYAVPLETLHKASGSAAPLKEFARQVRNALSKLAAVGAVREQSNVKNGRVAIFKVSSAAPKPVNR
ncbi:replication initiator protein A [Oxalobacteraceae sp. CFBP 13708]|nr:replication initiator protein A [Oxalobacteraceae sp. CFBP 13708]